MADRGGGFASPVPVIEPSMLRPLVVSIAGPAGAGKSQLAKAVVEWLGSLHCARVPTDYFLTDPASIGGSGGGRLVYDWALLTERLAHPIGTELSTPDYDFARMRRRHDSGGLPFVLRAIMLTDAMEPFPGAPLRVLLVVPASIRRQRIIERDRVWNARVLDRWAALEATWDRVRQLRIAWDLVLDGTNAIEDNAASVSEVVLGSRRSDTGTRTDRAADRRTDGKERG